MRPYRNRVAFVVALTAVLALPAHASDEKLTSGPATGPLGKDIAQVKVPEGFLFADATQTRALLKSMGNPTDGSEVGLLAPQDQSQGWFVIFEWHDVGHVKDDDKDKIDADAILKSIREGTEAANEERRRSGSPTIEVVGWDEAPHYDARTHNLVWAIRGKGSDGDEVVNYDVRLLGRGGYVSATLVADPKTLSTLKPQLATLLGGFDFKKGQGYAEWVKGDKVAAYGLTALVAGGAGAAAAKLGLFAVLGKFLAKGWKLVVVALAGLGAGIKKFFGRGEGTTPS